jgi:hypothetical protein
LAVRHEKPRRSDRPSQMERATLTNEVLTQLITLSSTAIVVVGTFGGSRE